MFHYCVFMRNFAGAIKVTVVCVHVLNGVLLSWSSLAGFALSAALFTIILAVSSVFSVSNFLTAQISLHADHMFARIRAFLSFFSSSSASDIGHIVGTYLPTLHVLHCTAWCTGLCPLVLLPFLWIEQWALQGLLMIDTMCLWFFWFLVSFPFATSKATSSRCELSSAISPFPPKIVYVRSLLFPVRTEIERLVHQISVSFAFALGE